MRPLRLIPPDTRIRFVRARFFAFAFTGALLAATVVSLLTQGLNLGIDFRGGIVIEAVSRQPIDIGAIRAKIQALDVGQSEIQRFGSDRSVLIRIPPPRGSDTATQAVVTRVKAALGPAFTYRRTDAVGPRVGSELLHDGVIATVLALLGITIYVAFRFEWQFGVAALIATGHDVVMAIGLYTVFQLDFDLVAIAALLTLAGYSINDTIVVFDRLRENLRKYKRTDLRTLIDRTCNETLSRTVMTSGTTLLAVLPMVFVGGPVLFAFSLAIAWGIAIGTFSSIYVASALLLYLPKLEMIRGRSDEEPTLEGPVPHAVGKPPLAQP
jgi:preprotein translocase subunit SecF